MKEIFQKVPGNVPDPIAKLVRETRIADGKTRLTTLHSEGTTCTAQTG